MKKHLKYIILFVFIDYLSAFCTWIVFFYARKTLLNEDFQSFTFNLFVRSFAIGLFWILLYYIDGFYSKDIFRRSRLKESVSILRISLIGSIILFFILLLDDVGIVSYKLYYKTYFSLLSIHIFFTLLSKLILISIFQKLVKQVKIYFNTLVVGSGENAIKIIEEIQQQNKHLGLKIIGYSNGILPNSKNLMPLEVKNLGNYSHLESIIKEYQIEEVVVAVEPKEHERLQEILTIIDNTGITIKIIPDLYHILLGSVKVSNLIGTPLIEVNKQLLPYWQLAIKRIIDIFISLVVITIGFPFFIIISFLIRKSSKGPILFKQERIGLHAKPFLIYKFRSMYIDAEKNGPSLSFENDPRITPFGRYMRKTRIDEFPQFFNVLKGEMSLVGPRPERQFYIDQICKQAGYYKHLHKVKPGITSLGQVKYGYAENVDEMVQRLKYEVLYIENMSLAMDFRIILFTILIVLQGKGK